MPGQRIGRAVGHATRPRQLAPSRRWRVLAEASPDLLLSVDRHGVIRAINRPITPSASALAVGADVSSLVPADQRESFRALIDGVLRSSQPREHEYADTTDTGATVRYVTRIEPVTHDGQVIGATLHVCDVSATRVLAESLSLLRSTLHATADGVLVVSADGRVVLSNRRFAAMWGIPDDVLASRDDERLLAFVADQLVDPGAFLAKIRELYEEPQAEMFDVLHFKDGRVVRRSSRPRRLAGRVVGRVWTFHDVTTEERALQAHHRALAELQTEKRRLDAVLDQAPSGFVIAAAPSGRILVANRRAEAIAGRSPLTADGFESYRDRFVGYDTDGRQLGPDDWPLARAIRAGIRTEQQDVLLERTNGVRQTIQASAAPIYDADGALVAGVVAFEDVTERRDRERRLDEAVSRWRALVDAVDGIVWESDADVHFTFVSQQAERLLGYPVEAWSDPDFWPSHLHPDDRDRTLDLCRSCIEGMKDHELEYRMIAADGRIVVLRDLVNLVLRDGVVVGMRGLMVDITAQRRLEAEREELLVREQAARRVAEDAVRTRDDFLSVAGHELRSPLSALRLQLATIERTVGAVVRDAASASRLSDLVRVGQNQVRRMSKLVADLLDVSRMGHGLPTLERGDVDLSALVRDIAERSAKQLDAVGCALELDVQPGIRGVLDGSRIEQVVVNLLGNAMKFSPGKPITLRLVGDDERAVLSVCDRGLGIAPRDHARIFGRFERAVDGEQYGGVGLGLFITRQIVEAHGGTIEVSSAVDEGATFTITLPLRPAR